MKLNFRNLYGFLFGLSAFILFGQNGFALEVAFNYQHDFIGVKKCKMCHNKEKTGKQFDVWKKAKHSKAYLTLSGEKKVAGKYPGNPKAIELAKKAGVKGLPHEAQECLICHSSAFDASKKRLGKSFELDDGVQCERCHGAGNDYKSKKTMEQITKEFKVSGQKSSKTAVKTGLIKSDKALCLECHSESITYKGKQFLNPTYSKVFNFEEAIKKISHPNPMK
ncbi:MAG: cytochrome c family protein [Deltaproteobacteria bacterium]|nr:cytochrome c family protein [Deltaproteobacteria bacterium]